MQSRQEFHGERYHRTGSQLDRARHPESPIPLPAWFVCSREMLPTIAVIVPVRCAANDGVVVEILIYQPAWRTTFPPPSTPP